MAANERIYNFFIVLTTFSIPKFNFGINHKKITAGLFIEKTTKYCEIYQK